MKQALEIDEDQSSTEHLSRKIRPRGHYAAAYRAGHQTTVTVRVEPEAFQQMTPADALAEANKIALDAAINGIERIITIEHLQEAECPPKWRVSFNLLVRQNVHEGNLRVEISAFETSLNK